MGQESEEKVENQNSQGTNSGAAAEQSQQGERSQSSKNLIRISSPEQVDDYIRVTTPGMWLLVSAILILLAAGIIWAYAARLEIKSTRQDGTVTTEYVKPASFLTDGVVGS